VSALLRVFLPLLVGYATALWWCVERWNAPTGYFGHCWLLPGVAALVVWLRRRTWGEVPAVYDPSGFWLLGPGLLVHLYGALLMIDSASAAGLVFAVPGAAWLALGRARLAGLWPALWLVLFAVPAPIYVEGRAAFVLKEFAVQAGASLGNRLGADVVRAGANLQLAGRTEALFVADACSGLRSLLGLLTVAYCLAFFVGAPRGGRRAVLLLAAAPIAVAANVVRIAALCLLARAFGVPFAEGTGHLLANVCEWVAALGALLLLDAWCSRGAAPPGPAAPVRMPAGPRLVPPRVAAALWLAGAALLALSLLRPAGGDQGRAARLPPAVGAFQHAPRDEQELARYRRDRPRFQELLGTPDFAWERYRDAQGRFVHLVLLYHDSNWKSVHPPRICIEGTDMDIEADAVVAAPWLGDGATVSRIVARSRSDRSRHLTLSLFGTRDWSSGSYEAFWWHHMPRALLRDNASGFLVRVETLIRRGEDDAAAERRCAAFLQDLLPLVREPLR